MATIVSRADYFDAAFDILSTTGHGDLKLAPLCRALNVTTGSFYNYFASWAEFKTGFLEDWLERRTVQLVEFAEQKADPVERLELLIDLALALPHRAEASIRAWGHSDPEVHQTQVVVDGRRHAVTYEAVAAIVDNAQTAESLTRMGMYLTSGFQQVYPAQQTTDLRWSLGQLLDLIVAARKQVDVGETV